MTIDVAAALIQDAMGRYLITRRRPGRHLEGFWEFPGGKRQPGETIEGCLQRELREELAATFAVGELVDTIAWAYGEHTVVLHFYRCAVASGEIVAQESQAMRWVSAEELVESDFPPADAALVRRLRPQAAPPTGAAPPQAAPPPPPTTRGATPPRRATRTPPSSEE
jgi:8-oxo-dGTP diphosphatase